MGVQAWRWFGKPGHFIAADRCHFHLCTLVGDGRYLVSTIGEYVPWSVARDQHSFDRWRAANGPGEYVGCDRKYETMVFKAGRLCNRSDCFCLMPEHDGQQLDAEGYMTAGEAQAGHMRLCRKWDKK